MPRKVLPAVVACAALCVPGAASAAPRITPASAQSAAVKTKTNAQLTRSVTALNKGTKAFGAAIAKLRVSQADTASKLQGVLDGVPLIVNGLGQLRDGLTTLASAYQAVEYGAIVGQINLPDGTTQVTPALVSPDIPDDGNTAGISAQFPINLQTPAIPVPDGSPLPATPPATVRLKAAIRSNESDGKSGSSDPAGQVGALLYATCIRNGGCGPNAPAGAQVCTPTQTPASDFSIPDGTKRSLNLVNVPTANSRTSSAPDVNSIDTGASGCNLPVGGRYILFVNAQFVDIPTKLSPGPTD